jgi:hypothetical protein
MALRKDLTYVKEFETAPQPPAIQSLKNGERGGVALTRSGFFADGACEQSDPTPPYGISR